MQAKDAHRSAKREGGPVLWMNELRLASRALERLADVACHRTRSHDLQRLLDPQAASLRI
jgi:hypothetical protein